MVAEQRELTLINTIRAHDLEGLERALAACDPPEAIVDWIDEQGKTPLLWAVHEGLFGAVEQLLRAGADPNLGPRPDVAPLPYSISLRENRIAAMLMHAKGLDKQSHGYFAALNAVISGYVEGLQCLIDNGLNLSQDVPQQVARTAHPLKATALLFTATAHALHRPELFRCLLAQGADPNALSIDGHTPATLACQKRDEYPAALQALLDAGASPEKPDRAGYGPLHHATANNHLDSVRLLLDSGAPANQFAEDGTFALLWAAANPYAEVHTVLLDQSADFPDDMTRTPSQFLNSEWSWSPGTSRWGGLTLAPGDGAWHSVAWTESEEQIMAELHRHYGAGRGTSPPYLVVYREKPLCQHYGPFPWQTPGYDMTMTVGQPLYLSYFAPLVTRGILPGTPSYEHYRFVLAPDESTDSSSAINAALELVSLHRIVTFTEGHCEELATVRCSRQDNQWHLR